MELRNTDEDNNFKLKYFAVFIIGLMLILVVLFKGLYMINKQENDANIEFAKAGLQECNTPFGKTWQKECK